MASTTSSSQATNESRLKNNNDNNNNNNKNNSNNNNNNNTNNKRKGLNRASSASSASITASKSTKIGTINSNAKIKKTSLPLYPLYNNILQPSSPPPSATLDQLGLWTRVLKRRTSQIQSLDKESLLNLYDFLYNSKSYPFLFEELTDLFRNLPSKKPSEKEHYISVIRYLLIENFHKSVDSRCGKQERTQALTNVKDILSNVDEAHSNFVTNELKEKEQEGKKREEEEKKKATLKRKILEQQEQQHTVSEKNTKHIQSVTDHHQIQIQQQQQNHYQNQQVQTIQQQKQQKHKQQQKQQQNQQQEYQQQQNTAIAPSSSASNSLTSFASPILSSNNMGSVIGKDATITSTSSLSFQKNDIIDLIDSPDSDSHSKVNENTDRKKNDNQENSPDKTKITMQQQSKQQPMMQPSVQKRRETPLEHITRTDIIRSLSFAPDTSVPTFSASLEPRPNCNISYHYPSSVLQGPSLDDIYTRFAKWEPFWSIVHDPTIVTDGIYEWGYKSADVYRCIQSHGEKPRGVCDIEFKILPEIINSLSSHGPIAWGCPRTAQFEKSYLHGERRLLVRMLPIKIPEKYKNKRADTHLWAKGSFLQLNSRPINIIQRKQQNHDLSLWKGMCHPLDITPNIHLPNGVNRLQICTRDDSHYALQVVLCDYISPDELYNMCMNDNSHKSILKLSYQEGLDNAMTYLNKKPIAVLSDDEDEYLKEDEKKHMSKKIKAGKQDTSTNNESDSDNSKNIGTDKKLDADSKNITISFSLLCPMSMACIQTPVRGKKCKHMQCFDLRNYLQFNVHISGGRWRCAVCEDFVAVNDLVVDGFVTKMLDLHKDEVCGSRDKILVSSNGSWKFGEENRLRYGVKSRKRSNSATDDNIEIKNFKSDEGDVKSSKPTPIEEVIDLDD